MSAGAKRKGLLILNHRMSWLEASQGVHTLALIEQTGDGAWDEGVLPRVSQLVYAEQGEVRLPEEADSDQALPCSRPQCPQL